MQLSLPLAVEAPTGDSDPSGSSLEVRTEIGGYHDEEIGQSSACDWLDPPPLSGAFAMEETQHRIGDEGVMLEAFQQFQHNPQIQVRTDTMLTCTHIIEIMFVLTTFETTFCFKKSTSKINLSQDVFEPPKQDPSVVFLNVASTGGFVVSHVLLHRTLLSFENLMTECMLMSLRFVIENGGGISNR